MKMTRHMIRTLAAGSLAVAMAMPALAQVSVGVGVGVGGGPGYNRHWCYNHPAACRHGGGYAGGPGVAVGIPAIGVYVAGRGYWDGHGWYGHRYWDRGVWRYR